MNFNDFSRLFTDACQKNNLIAPSNSQIEMFWSFDTLLAETNRVTNLTAIRNTEDAIYKHYVDSLLVSSLIPPNAHVLDLGCGPGFPSIPLSIMRPDLSFAALDSTDKKIRFVKDVAIKLNLGNLTPVTGRAEELGVRSKLGCFDVVVSRAVSRMNVLAELCMPYLKIGGKLLAMKGAKAEEELKEAQNAIRILGGKAILHKRPLILENCFEERFIIDVVKTSATPPQYPRQYSAIIKKPL